MRTLVRRELDRNSELLNGYWERVADSREDFVNDRGDPLIFKLGVAATEATLPDLDLEAWTQNLNGIPEFYSDSELKRIWKEVERFRQIKQRHSHLQRLIGSYYATKGNKANTEARMDAGSEYRGGKAPGQYQANLNRLLSIVKDETLKLKSEIEEVVDSEENVFSLPQEEASE